MSFNTRRLSDKILVAFHQACDQGHAEAAEHLLRALELTVTRYGGQGKVDRREIEGATLDAYRRLQVMKRQALELVGVEN